MFAVEKLVLIDDMYETFVTYNEMEMEMAVLMDSLWTFRDGWSRFSEVVECECK